MWGSVKFLEIWKKLIILFTKALDWSK